MSLFLVSGSGLGCFAPGRRLALTLLRRSVVLDLEGRERAAEVVEGLERRDVSWEVKSSELERAISFFCFLGGGCP